MFNETDKLGFLSSDEGYNTGRNSVRSVFNRIEPQESAIGKDICEMDKAETIFTIEHSFDDYDVAKNAVVIIRLYAKWRRIDAAINAITVADLDLSTQLARIILRSPEHLAREISSVRSLDDGYIEPVVLALAWLGLSWAEILGLRDSDVDLDAGIIHNDADGAIEVPNAVLDILRRYEKCNESFRDNKNGAIHVTKDKTTPGFLRKLLPENSQRVGQGFTRPQLDVALSRFGSAYEDLGNPPRLSVLNCIRSGGYYRLRKLEESGVDLLSSKNKALVLRTYRAPKNYYSLKRMYGFYRKAFTP